MRTQVLAVRWLAVLVVSVVAIAGCSDGDGGGTDPSATPTAVATPAVTATEGSLPTPSASPTATSPAVTGSATPSATASEEAVTFFLVREAADRLWVEPVTDPQASVTDGAVARAAFTALLAASDRPGLVDPVPEGTRLVDVAVADGLLTVDLSGEVATNPGAGGEGENAFQQVLAHTGAQFSTVDRVQLLVDGQAVTELWGHVDWSQPVEADPFAVSPIVVTSASGSSDGSIDLAGTANTFEAVFGIAITGPDGAVAEDTFIMASCGSGCRGDWTHRLEAVEPGTYRVVLTEDDPSDGEGRSPFSVALDVTVPG